MRRNSEELSEAHAELARIGETLAQLFASPTGDEARIVALDLRARELRRRIDSDHAGRGLGPCRNDGFYGSGY